MVSDASTSRVIVLPVPAPLMVLGGKRPGRSKPPRTTVGAAPTPDRDGCPSLGHHHHHSPERAPPLSFRSRPPTDLVFREAGSIHCARPRRAAAGERPRSRPESCRPWATAGALFSRL